MIAFSERCHPRKFYYDFFLGCPGVWSGGFVVAWKTCVLGLSGSGLAVIGSDCIFWALPS